MLEMSAGALAASESGRCGAPLWSKSAAWNMTPALPAEGSLLLQSEHHLKSCSQRRKSTRNPSFIFILTVCLLILSFYMFFFSFYTFFLLIFSYYLVNIYLVIEYLNALLLSCFSSTVRFVKYRDRRRIQHRGLLRELYGKQINKKFPALFCSAKTISLCRLAVRAELPFSSDCEGNSSHK